MCVMDIRVQKGKKKNSEGEETKIACVHVSGVKKRKKDNDNDNVRFLNDGKRCCSYNT